jgi:hypothetical protein
MNLAKHSIFLLLIVKAQKYKIGPVEINFCRRDPNPGNWRTREYGIQILKRKLQEIDRVCQQRMRGW